MAAVAVVLWGLAAWPHATAALPNDGGADGRTDDKTIVHVLNRIGFGPRPGDVGRVRDIGLQRYIEQQLRPDRIADTAVDARLAGLTTIRMSAEEIRTTFEQPQMEARRRAPDWRRAERQAGRSRRRPRPRCKRATIR